MKHMSKNKLIISSFIILTLIIIVTLISIFACSNGNKTPNNTANTGNENEVSDNISTSTVTSTGTVTSDSTITPDGNNSTVNTSDTDKSSEDSSSAKKKSQELLSNIMDTAKSGKVINCDFAVKNTNISDVEEKWGKADSSEWITAAKGRYSTYTKHDIVLGSNKGEQVFEVRYLNNQLNIIQLSAIKDKFGTPQYDAKVNGEEIIGYKITDEIKILFVFKQGTTDPVLIHYSVLYPIGTINSMAGDKGREW